MQQGSCRGPRVPGGRWRRALLASGAVSAQHSPAARISARLSVRFPGWKTLALSNDSGLWSMLWSGVADRFCRRTVARNPGFSPDGTFLVYQAEHSGQWDLWLLALAGGDSRQITSTDYDEVEPVFWPDGHSVVFASNRSGTYDVWELHLSSGALRRLTGRSGDASFPSVSEHGDVVEKKNELDQAGSLYLLPYWSHNAARSPNDPLRAPSWRPGGGVVVSTNNRPDAEQPGC